MNETSENAPPKSAKQLEKEAKKLAKLEKFKQKQEQKTAKVSSESTEKKDKKKPQKKVAVEYKDETVPGMKKDLSQPMPDTYNPAYVEAAWYSWWEKEGFFKPEYGRKSLRDCSKGRFVMVIPPPNVTGTLHVGHALTNAVEDALTRWNRMKGRLTLWTPGCDHAGIATQVVVEKKLWRECKKTRHDIGREEFIKKIWEWRNEKGDRIYLQLRRLGSSLDWERASFTMDPKLSRAVTEAFVRLYDEGDIYRSNRLVNWSCSLKSAISDIEVDKVELPGRTFLSIPGYNEKVEFGVLVHFAYEIARDSENDEKEYVVVATTRIETMLGDVAIAVHPQDDRYKHLHNKFVIHPFCDRKMPIICDDFVEKGFGTGVVKITPAHDPNDYEVGKRHNLPFLTILSDEGLIIGDCTQFNGMKRFDARKAILEALKQKGLYRETKDNPMVVPVCNRSKDIIEPMIKPQWYVKCDKMAELAMKAVQDGELKITPSNHVKIWNHWMENIRDWCVSRQLWWGHRIPAYRIIIDSGENFTTNEDEQWICGRNEQEAKERAAKKFKIDINKITLEQDSDVLDTWFSSALFPFSVFGWPDQTEDLNIFYPNTLLETGHDILFFWVAKMVFLGQRLLNKLPFKEVFLHPMVRDAHGRKMSKSLGNVIDPMDVIQGITLEKLHEQLYTSNLDPKEIEKAKQGQKQDYPNGIPECGTDALRFALCAYMSQARDINLDILRVQGYRFFCNKIWNAVKFALMYLPSATNSTDFVSTLNSNCDWFKDSSASGSQSEREALSVLNARLASNSYVNGYQLTEGDLKVFSSLNINENNHIDSESFPHLLRWKKHVAVCRNQLQLLSIKKTSPMNLWIMSRLAAAVEMTNRGFENYDFNASTTGCYNLWLYDLCDIYLESLKPVFALKDEERIFEAQQTLVHVIDCGLKLLSPFMPYITEELYQRLPLSKTAASVCVASYPESDDYSQWRNEEIEAQVEMVMKIVHSIRSAQSDYNLPKSSKPNAYICSTDENISSYLDNYKITIQTLAYCGNISINEHPPLGCTILTVSDKCQVHLYLKGLIDIPKELEKMKKTEETVIQNIAKLRKAIDAPNYETKVPKDVQASNTEKLAMLLGELRKLEEAQKSLLNVLNST